MAYARQEVRLCLVGRSGLFKRLHQLAVGRLLIDKCSRYICTRYQYDFLGLIQIAVLQYFSEVLARIVMCRHCNCIEFTIFQFFYYICNCAVSQKVILELIIYIVLAVCQNYVAVIAGNVHGLIHYLCIVAVEVDAKIFDVNYSHQFEFLGGHLLQYVVSDGLYVLVNRVCNSLDVSGLRIQSHVNMRLDPKCLSIVRCASEAECYLVLAAIEPLFQSLAVAGINEHLPFFFYQEELCEPVNERIYGTRLC